MKMIEIKGQYGKGIIYTDNVEVQAMGQLIAVLNQPLAYEAHMRIMPDVHYGAGCTIGTTLYINDKVVPNMVGVDIGCGVTMVSVGKDEINLESLNRWIKQNIPMGFNKRDKPICDLEYFIGTLRCIKAIPAKMNDYLCSLGTLGGGNHFIELDIAEDGEQFLSVHSGSRNFGLQIALYYQALAVSKMVPGSKIPKDLAYLEGQDLEDYLHDMKIAQMYAGVNRELIIMSIQEGYFKKQELAEGVIDSVHNYIDIEKRIVRKGAISAEKGEMLVIPLNMRDGILLCKGKGNVEWNNSAPHGAGRLYSRGAAKRTFTIEEFQESMEGIYSTSVVKSTIDECPMAYKPAAEIKELIGDTVEIIAHLKPVLNIKST